VRARCRALDELPDAVFVLLDGAPRLVLGADLLSWSLAGYLARIPRPSGRDVILLTPPSMVAVLRAGWDSVLPLLHPSALTR